MQVSSTKPVMPCETWHIPANWEEEEGYAFAQKRGTLGPWPQGGFQVRLILAPLLVPCGDWSPASASKCLWAPFICGPPTAGAAGAMRLLSESAALAPEFSPKVAVEGAASCEPAERPPSDDAIAAQAPSVVQEHYG